MSRQKYEKHIIACVDGSPSTSSAVTAVPVTSSQKAQRRAEDEGDDNEETEVQDIGSFNAESWVEVQGEKVDEDEDDQDDCAERFERFQEKLISVTGNRHTAEFLLRLTEPVAIILQNGETENVLALPGGTKRLLQDTVVSIQQAKRQAANGKHIQDGELRTVLATHTFGDLVDESVYHPLDDELCCSIFRQDGSNIAKRLAGALTQSGAAILLVLKVEVYRRSPLKILTSNMWRSRSRPRTLCNHF
ncbi:hypothetical protein BGZ68_006453 [Mortierella alpina]|nr:hypothetical protein BGZ68_006453 [Mortierella alpina]